MGSKKSKQRIKQSLNIFGRIWNASKATPEQKAAAAEHFGDGPGPANGHSDNSERRPRKMKGVGLLIILFVALLALLIYHRSTMKKSKDLVGQTKVESTAKPKHTTDDLIDTISSSRITQIPKRQERVQEEEVQQVQEVQKQQPEPEPEKPVKAEPKYAPNGEVLIQMPVYPDGGFDTYQEREQYFNTIKAYWEQQRRISSWMTQNHTN